MQCLDYDMINHLIAQTSKQNSCCKGTRVQIAANMNVTSGSYSEHGSKSESVWDIALK